ncbi:hypothetical protein VFPPC_17584 [Pochonia chlamydosporia 170]|uniref:Uncharacterized protein n=1 Tax=Pochonia chlamydosporia 170 TaxID=1380566 RepID=A0A219AR39_METCM|nr:hypothetical protein VFPPC_17584 [Pochonia chlamydosporia 170]OWT43253.1 hypothetical protein VFPPC_17584 [Pochonia chlamydosporia 170]
MPRPSNNMNQRANVDKLKHQHLVTSTPRPELMETTMETPRVKFDQMLHVSACSSRSGHQAKQPHQVAQRNITVNSLGFQEHVVQSMAEMRRQPRPRASCLTKPFVAVRR